MSFILEKSIQRKWCCWISDEENRRGGGVWRDGFKKDREVIYWVTLLDVGSNMIDGVNQKPGKEIEGSKNAGGLRRVKGNREGADEWK